MRYRFLRFPGGKTKSVTYSYDDGCRQDIKVAEILKRYGIRGTFNINSGLFGEDDKAWRLTKDEVQKHIVDAGFEIAIHGDVHSAPGLCRSIDGIQEFLNCRLKLEKEFGFIIRGMAYPDSGITKMMNQADYENIKRYLKDLDIVYSRTLNGDNDNFILPTDWYAWMPTAHHKNPKVMEYANKFIELDVNKQYGANRYPRLFYLWGHGFEFDRDDNWNLLEELCECFAGKEDIWYATNMEIYEYVEAYNSLVFSADGNMVYNPTLVDVWFDVDGKLYEIKSGERIVIEKNI